MGRTKQGGSVLSFIIVGILLLGALAGGVYLYRHVWAPGAGQETASKPSSPSETNAPAQNNGNGSSKSSDSSKSSSDTSNGAPSSTPAQPSQPKPAPAPQSQSQPSSQLPTTGPADTLTTMLILGVITAAAAAYAQSRRAVRSL